jgi:hypothetical protein
MYRGGFSELKWWKSQPRIEVGLKAAKLLSRRATLRWWECALQWSQESTFYQGREMI